jgi:hypothetical protein
MTRSGDVIHAGPERRLMAAVLWRAVDDCLTENPGAEAPRKTMKARSYVASRDRTWPFSFENLCESLGVSAHRVRRELARGREPHPAVNGLPRDACARTLCA